MEYSERCFVFGSRALNIFLRVYHKMRNVVDSKECLRSSSLNELVACNGCWGQRSTCRLSWTTRWHYGPENTVIWSHPAYVMPEQWRKHKYNDDVTNVLPATKVFKGEKFLNQRWVNRNVGKLETRGGQRDCLLYQSLLHPFFFSFKAAVRELKVFGAKSSDFINDLQKCKRHVCTSNTIPAYVISEHFIYNTKKTDVAGDLAD